MENWGIAVAIISICLFLGSLAIAAFIAAKHASEHKYLCKSCKKAFTPRKRDAFGAAYSFGHISVLVRCPHCKHKARLLPLKEEDADK